MTLKPRLLTAALLAAASLGLACAGAQKPAIESTSTITEEEGAPADAQATGTAAQPAPAPVQVTFQPLGEPDKFTVQFPGQVEPKRTSVPTQTGGQIDVAGWTLNVGGIAYSITAQDYPEALVAKNPPAAFLNQGRNEVVGYLKGTVTGEQEADVQGYPGKAFTATSTSGDVKGRVALVGRRLYTMFTLAPQGTDTTVADTFLNSLTLINPPPQVPYQKKGAPAAGKPAAGAATPATPATPAPPAKP